MQAIENTIKLTLYHLESLGKNLAREPVTEVFCECKVRQLCKRDWFSDVIDLQGEPELVRSEYHRSLSTLYDVYTSTVCVALCLLWN